MFIEIQKLLKKHEEKRKDESKEEYTRSKTRRQIFDEEYKIDWWEMLMAIVSNGVLKLLHVRQTIVDGKFSFLSLVTYLIEFYNNY